MDRWQGRVAVVTGASEGIGEAIVRRLAANGLKVVALARRQHLLEDLVKDVNSKSSGICHYQVCDVSDELQVRKAFEWVQKNVGPVSILVNNAAIFKYMPINDLVPATVKSTIDINVTGVLYCIHHGLASMKSAGITDGHIININRYIPDPSRGLSGFTSLDINIFPAQLLSLCGHKDLMITGLGIYTAGKHALTILTSSLKKELGEAKSHIRVTSISPGLVETSMSTWYTQDNPQAPKLSPHDVVETVVFALASPKHVNISEITIQPTGEGSP